MGTMSRLGWAIFLSGTLFCTVVHADPSTLHIGSGVDTSCATGGCPIFSNGELNNIESTGLDIYQTSGGAPILSDPVLLILAIPNNIVALNSDTITTVSLYSSQHATPVPLSFSYGASKYGISGSAGNMTSSNQVSDIYDFLKLPGKINRSNSLNNWSYYDSIMLHQNVDDFGIYVYSLNTSDFGPNDFLDVKFSGIPEGTFAVAFGEATTKSGKVKYFGTPITEAGLQDTPGPIPVPEPSTLALFAGLLTMLAGTQALRRLRSVPL